jgi:hypothetical protein
MENFEKGQKLKKNFDGTIVTISSVSKDYIVLDGDFEPKHIVMKEKVSLYYSGIK